jgi:hypothetical protein
MNRSTTRTAQIPQGPLARFGRRVAAIVTELNHAQNQLASARHTPERF